MSSSSTRRSDGRSGRATAESLFHQVSDPAARLAATPVFLTSSRLSPRDSAIVQTVQRYRLVSARQVERLFFADGSERSRGIRKRRTMARLVKWGEVKRLERPVGGWSGGSEGFIYQPTGSKLRIADPHTLDIAELFVRLVEAERKTSRGEVPGEVLHPHNSIKLLAFDPEPFCHVQLGQLELKPDAFVRLKTPDGTSRFFVEVDRGTEWRTQLGQKMRRYFQAYINWPEDTFPKCVWLVPDEQRKRLMESVVRRQEVPALFDVQLFEDAMKALTE